MFRCKIIKLAFHSCAESTILVDISDRVEERKVIYLIYDEKEEHADRKTEVKALYNYKDSNYISKEHFEEVAHIANPFVFIH